ncbi:MAG TPA: glycosyltransferase [Methylomirabilota bacterium]|nr:glycosyltransferase [Methylomirabilota bacterium]
MSPPWLTVVIPTVGRESLIETLHSWTRQDIAGVELLVVGDSYGGPHQRLLWARHLADEFGARYLDFDGGQHMVGQPQRNYGQREARGDWLAFSQDDNVATAIALGSILDAVSCQPHKQPLFFRWLAPWRETIWRQPVLRAGNIDADCLVFPRTLVGEVTWGMRYEGDFDAAACLEQRGPVEWREEVIAVARPSQEHRWWTAA